jgi:uncharacterized protein (UPF0332 family)
VYEDLIEKKLIERTPIYKDEIWHLKDAAQKDIETAKFLIRINSDWALNIAYSALLRISLALMYDEGYRPKGEAKHKVVVEFLREKLGRKFREELERIDDLRRKRNRMIYHASDVASEYEVKETIEFAKEFINRVSKLIK